MPTYSFKDNNTGEEFDEFMGMSEKDKYLEDNPHISQVPVLFAFVGDHIKTIFLNFLIIQDFLLLKKHKVI